MSDWKIRPIGEDEMALLPVIERRSDQRYIDAGFFSEDDIGPEDFTLARYQQSGGDTLVAVDGNDLPIGFVHYVRLEQGLHIEELSVVPEWGRKGIGTALIDRVKALALDVGAFAVTLSTDILVPWNTPYYEKLGFEAVSPMALGPAYLTIRAKEAARALDPRTRHMMVWYCNPVSRNEQATARKS